MSNIIVITKSTTAIIEERLPAKLPIGEQIALQGCAQDQHSEETGASIGIWESTPGVFRRALKNREFIHILNGWCIFIPDNGEPIKLCAGDAVLFPENCEGIWDIKETLRKTYILF